MATLDERVALLEQKLGAITTATTPPIQIGELTDVPAPGSQIAANWAQEVSARIIHRYASKAALNGWTTALVGTHAVTLDTGILYRRVTGAWAQVTPWEASSTGIASAYGGASPVVVNNLQTPADPASRLARISCFLRVDRVPNTPDASVSLLAGGTKYAETFLQFVDNPVGYRTVSVTMTAQVLLPINVATNIEVAMYSSGPGGSGQWQTFADPAWNRLDVLVVPKGY